MKLLDKQYFTDSDIKVAIIYEIMNAISLHGLSVDINEYEFNLILDEAITNAMEHGNKWNPNKKITVSMLYEQNNLLISISDQGQGIDSEKAQGAILNESDLLSKRGRGLKIISNIAGITIDGNDSRIDIKVKVTSKVEVEK